MFFGRLLLRAPGGPHARCCAAALSSSSGERVSKHARCRAAAPSTSGSSGERVSKVLSRRGVCSRREADELLRRGEVLVDGAATAVGGRAFENARIELTESGRSWLEGKRLTILLHKPPGYVSSNPRPGETEARALLTPENHHGDDPQLAQRVFENLRDVLSAAGRLDKMSRGLLLLTTDGAVAKALVGSALIYKSYLVKVDSPVSDNQLRRLCSPMRLEDTALRPMRVTRSGELLEFRLNQGSSDL